MEVEQDKNASEEDIWDDTILIKAYDNSVKLTKIELAKRLAKAEVTNKENTRNETAIDENCHNENATEDLNCNYKVGDYIRATYDDGIDYEAEILSIDKEKQTCILKYIGYGNEQEVKISDLVPSWGKRARRLQYIKAKEHEDGKVGGEYNDGYKTNDNKKSRKHHSHNLNLNFNGNGLADAFNNSIPPPPPMPPMLNESSQDSENFSAMLMSWYLSGYYTGLYQGQKNARNFRSRSKR